MRERFLHLSLSLVGQKVTLTQTNGAVLDGIFHTFTPFDSQPDDKRNKYVLKAVQVIAPGSADFSSLEKGSTVIIPAEKVAFIHVKSMRLEAVNGSKEGFRTDTEISSQQSTKGRELVSAGNAWTNTAATAGNARAEALVGGLEGCARKQPSTTPLRGNIGEWDQFRANEELFDVRATYDENLYTTELDKSSIDRSKLKEAERLAREIESTMSTNIHVAEERNQVIGGDFDEEDRYSGVLDSNLVARNKDSPKKMNYAAAAAKAKVDTNKPAPPGFVKVKDEEEKKETKESFTSTKGAESPTAISTTKEEMPADEIKAIEEIKDDPEGETSQATESNTMDSVVPKAEKEESKDTEKQEAKADAPKPSLNPEAKSFSFNPGAKTFTPTFGNAPVPVQAHELQMIDPSTGMAIMPHHMMGYLPHPSMGQPGMMQMMNPQFATMRFPGPYPGMEQHMGHVLPHHQPQHQMMPGQMPLFVPPMQDGSAISPPIGDDETQAGEGQPPLQQQQSQPPPPQPGIPMQYPPNPYYTGGMQMHPGQPRGPQMGGYHPQMVGAPQQIPGVTGRNPYQQMYGMPQPPPQMLGPNGAPYYVSPPQLYPHYMMDDEYRGGRGGRGRGISGRRKPNGRGGRGGRGYQNTYNPNSGRHTPQNGPPNPDEQPPGSSSREGETSELNQDSIAE